MDSSNALVHQAPDSARLREMYSDEVLRQADPKRGKAFLEACGYGCTTEIYKEYDRIIEKESKNLRAKQEFVARFMLSTYHIVKLREVKVFYVEEGNSSMYKRCPSYETLCSEVAMFYQVLFGFNVNIDKTVDAMVAAILPKDLCSEIDRSYIQIVGGYYWNRRTADICTVLQDPNYEQVPSTARCFAKMFDTDVVDKNVFKVPEFDDDDVDTMLETYNRLKDISYYDWPDEYHFQCFKDWSKDRLGVSYGMMTVPALSFMRVLPRGSIFNDGDGHNGKSVLNGLAVSIIGSNNVSTIVGDELGSWDHLVNLQTTWLNIPNETTVDFLKSNSEAFKAMSAQETYTVRHKHGDVSIPVVCDFPMVFNINKLPEFGQDSGAVLSRMFINRFEVDFEAEGRAVKDYAKKVFLSDKTTMPTIVGAVLAFAHYYSQDEHLWEESEEMLEAKALLSETAAPKKAYCMWMSKFFNSFSGIKIPKTDYINFGYLEGETYDGNEIKRKDHFFGKFRRISSENGTYYKNPEGEVGYFARFNMASNLRITKYMGALSLDEYYEGHHSLVHDMMEDYLAKKEEYESKLKKSKISKTKEEIDKYVMSEMFRSIDQAQKGGFYGLSR